LSPSIARVHAASRRAGRRQGGWRGAAAARQDAQESGHRTLAAHAGAAGIRCAKLAEAGCSPKPASRTSAFHISESRGADRVRALLDAGVTLSIIADDPGVARQWSQAMAHDGRKLAVVKVDVGFRGAASIESPHAMDLVKLVSSLAASRSADC
jgi:hypothetical protein